jgi:hypothetical protein
MARETHRVRVIPPKGALSSRWRGQVKQTYPAKPLKTNPSNSRGSVRAALRRGVGRAGLRPGRR